MKFATYQRSVLPTTIQSGAAKVSSDANAYGGWRSAEATNAGNWKEAFGQVEKVYNKAQDDQDAADVMEARNKIMSQYNEALLNGEDGLLTKGVGSNAKGLGDRARSRGEEIFAELSGKYNGRVRNALRSNMNDWLNSKYQQAATQEANEVEKYYDGQYAGQLSQTLNDGINGWQINGYLTTVHKDMDKSIQAQGVRKGWSGELVNQEQRNQATQLYSGAITAAIGAGDYARAREIHDYGKRYMNVEQSLKLDELIKEREQNQQAFDLANNVYSQFYNTDTMTYDEEAARKYIFAKIGTSKGTDENTVNRGMDMKWEELKDVPMVNKNLGCVEFVTKFGSGFNPFLRQCLADGDVNVNVIREKAEERGMYEKTNDFSQLRKGDVAVFDSHVVVSDGLGGYYGNSSKSYYDSKGRITDKGHPVHSGDIGDLDMTLRGIIRSGVGGSSGSVYTLEDADRELQAINAAGRSKQESDRRQYQAMVEQTRDAVSQRIAAGDYSGALSIANSSGLRGSDKLALQRMASPPRSNGGSSGSRGGGSRSSGGYTDKERKKMDDVLELYSMKIERGEKISASLQQRANHAAKVRSAELGYNADLTNDDVYALVKEGKKAGLSDDEIIDKLADDNEYDKNTVRYYLNVVKNDGE